MNGILLLSALFVIGILPYIYIKRKVQELIPTAKDRIYRRWYPVFNVIANICYLPMYLGAMALFVFACNDFASLKLLDGVVKMLATLGVYRAIILMFKGLQKFKDYMQYSDKKEIA